MKKFILLLQKGDYLYEYMDDWKKANEISLSEKDFYGGLNMEDITDADYVLEKEFVKILKQNLLEDIIFYMFNVIHFS